MAFSALRKQYDTAVQQLSANPRAAAYAFNLFGFDGAGRVQRPTANLSATSITNVADLVPAQQGFKAALLEAVVGQADPLEAVAFEFPSNRAVEHHLSLGDLPQMEEWKNDRVMSTLSVEAEIVIANKKWQSAIKVKNDDIRDDNLGLLPGKIAGMGAEAALQPSRLIARMLLNGFDGDDASLGDGLAFDGDFFFSDSHATGSNKLTVAFSVDSLNTAITMLRSQKRFDGTNLYCKPTHLIVGIDNEQAAIKVLSSDYLATVFGATAAATESNVLKGRLQPIVSPLIENGEWFVADLSKPSKPMIFQNREGIQVNFAGGPNSGDFIAFVYDELWAGAHARNNAGYWDFRRIVGSKPS